MLQYLQMRKEIKEIGSEVFMLNRGGCWASLGRSRPSFSSPRRPPFITKLLGQPSPVWRLVSRLWNLCVKYSLCYPKPDFVGRLSFSTLAYCHTRQPLWLKLRTNAGSATPNIILRLKNSMGLSCSQAKTKTKPTSQAKAWWQVRFLLGCPI